MFQLTSNLPMLARFIRAVRQIIRETLLTENDREFRRLKSFITS